MIQTHCPNIDGGKLPPCAFEETIAGGNDAERDAERESKVRYKEHVPHALLQDHVKCFWIMERKYTREHPAEDVTPDAFIELILNVGEPYMLHVEGVPDREMSRAILVGLQRNRCSSAAAAPSNW